MSYTTTAVAALVLALAGCASVKSTMLSREDGDACVSETKLEGYPITVKVPTHIRLTVYEKFYVQENPVYAAILANESSAKTLRQNAEKPENNLAKTELISQAESIEANSLKMRESNPQASLPVKDDQGQLLTAIDFSTQLIETEKIFTVDHKRPAAGTLAFRSAVSKDQSIQRIQSSAEDLTIRQLGFGIAGMIATLTGAPPPEALAPAKTINPIGDFTGVDPNALRPVPPEVFYRRQDVVGDVSTQTRVLDIRIFDLNEPDLELQIMEFLEATINGRNRSCAASSPQGH